MIENVMITAGGFVGVLWWSPLDTPTKLPDHDAFAPWNKPELRTDWNFSRTINIATRLSSRCGAAQGTGLTCACLCARGVVPHHGVSLAMKSCFGNVSRPLVHVDLSCTIQKWGMKLVGTNHSLVFWLLTNFSTITLSFFSFLSLF